MPVWSVLIVLTCYIAALFAVAWRVDKSPKNINSSMVYALALAVYCTSWTYFGAVGTAVEAGIEYLAIYLGPAIIFLIYPSVVRNIADISKKESISSLSGFLSSRYGKSQSLGVLATTTAAVGVLPYISLQLKSIGMSFSYLTSGDIEAHSISLDTTVFFAAVVLAIFTILFGARNSDATQHNRGLMCVLALEAVVKLGALILVAGLSIWILSRNSVDVSREVSHFTNIPTTERFVTLTLLSMAAMICLPRQFHVAIVERLSVKDSKSAERVFPVYLLLTSLVVVPITWAGLSELPGSIAPDLFVLSLSQDKGNSLLALIVFLGGFSAASGMVIVSCMALSTMITNDLIVPFLLKYGQRNQFEGAHGVRLVLIRRFVIVGILSLTYLYYLIASSSQALAQSGLISFAAVIQFAPGLLFAIYWKGAHRNGVIAGLAVGAIIWVYTLLLPSMLDADIMARYLPAIFDPNALFGIKVSDPLTHGVFWSLASNIFVTILVSRQSQTRLRDTIQANAFSVENISKPVTQKPIDYEFLGEVKVAGLKTLTARFLTEEAVENAFADMRNRDGEALTSNMLADGQVIQETERLLSRSVGAASARVLISSAIKGSEVAFSDLLSILDQESLAQKFDRHLLQATLESIPQGISVVDGQQRLVAWNSAYKDFFGYPDELLEVGRPIEDLIHHNISTGWIMGDPREIAERRIHHMRVGRYHAYECTTPDGRWYRITGNPMPGGGYVTSFHDITLDKEREGELREANLTLESRVSERTQELQQLTEALERARQDAEAANASKTRFLAAASHDLLQPLNAARLFLGAIKPSSQNENHVEEIVQKADRSIQSADQLLKGLLDISRLDHESVEAKPERFPIGIMLEDLAEEAEPMAQMADLSVRVAPTSAWVEADPNFLQSILRNFISNARRYTQKGGILIGCRPVGLNHIRVEVWDTGPGISRENQATLFEEFSRFQDTDNLGLRGAGLGLSIVQRLAHLMKAKLEVKSIEGKGSVFSITIPRVEGQSLAFAKPAITKSITPSEIPELRILTLDDEVTILDAMQSLLTAWGMEVFTAHTIPEAHQILTENSIDVVFADYQLGADVDGIGFLKSIEKAHDYSPKLALLTAKSEKEIFGSQEKADITVLSKPVDPEAIKTFLLSIADSVD